MERTNSRASRTSAVHGCRHRRFRDCQRSVGIVFVPENAPPVKVARLEAYGAKAIAPGIEYATALAAAEKYVKRTGALYCHTAMPTTSRISRRGRHPDP
ncbi:hypothetical protein [Streptosporangium sp. NPDC087985]|uniref:hypothetical protein n=1 Tax=Streptosporangium sp. NPDC087985 TaxID=3366196 RepID=UPI003827C019